MSILLRVAAIYSLVWAVGCFFPHWFGVADDGAAAVRALANGLGISNLVFAVLFWRAAGDPARERTGMYAALMLFGLRGVSGALEVLYRLEGRAAEISLLDMVLSVALFVGLLNSLPSALEPPSDR